MKHSLPIFGRPAVLPFAAKIQHIEHCLHKMAIFLLTLSLSCGIYARQTLSNDSIAANRNTKNYNFKWKQTILPVSLIGVGALAVAPSFIRDGSHEITHAITDLRGNNKRQKFDDYVQYVPALGAITLGCVGVKAKHNLVERTLITGTSFAAFAVLTKGAKLCINEKRPQFDNQDAFPSGHTGAAFMGAELVRIEYGGWYAVGAYTIATGVGFMRMYNGEHWFHDVVAGAGVGILSARIGEWSCHLWQKLLSKACKRPNNDLVFMPVASPMNGGYYGFSMGCVF